MDLFSFPSHLGTELFSIINASSNLREINGVSAHQVLEIAARSLDAVVVTFTNSRSIVRAGVPWHGETPTSSTSLIEFDGYEHGIRIQDCKIYLHVEWPQVYHTLNVIAASFDRVFADDSKLKYIAGCTDPVELPLSQLQYPTEPETDDTQAIIFVPRVFDTFMINDELAMLELRLQTLEDCVDMHVLVESSVSFTGIPKPLYYNDSKHLFSKYAPRIIHVVLDRLAVDDVQTIEDVWRNEYFSRNRVMLGLERVGAVDDDVLLLCDVDEIPSPRSIATLKVALLCLQC